MTESTRNPETKQRIEAYWAAFLADRGLDPATRYYDASYFGMDEALARELLDLVLQGKKRATAGCLEAYLREGEPLPVPGDYTIVTDFYGNPEGVIRTTAVTLIPFNEMTFEVCSREGEDECLETWKAAHLKFFTADGLDLGYEFNEEMLVVFEDFELVYGGCHE
jgi:uncharacterized protein YhfF